jgi:hypothetical protein
MYYSLVVSIALRPTQPHIQWVLGFMSPEVKRPGREADPDLYLVLRPRMVELDLYSPIYLHGLVLN